MEILRRVSSMKEVAQRARGQGLKIGFVPTMGALHDGHLGLIRRINELCDVVVVSVFVNPTQFGPGEDFGAYPRNLTRDADLCAGEGVDYLFAPEDAEIYPPGPRARVEVEGLSERLEGASRPGHFSGVATVVLKLFHIVKPHVAAFGQKDAQQAIVIQRMVRDLMLDVEIQVLPIVREADGVAMSSRNRRLAKEDRAAAAAIPAALKAATRAVAEGHLLAEEVVRAARAVIDAEPRLRLDYLELVDPQTFDPVANVEGEALLLVAAFCGDVRLLDNAVIQP